MHHHAHAYGCKHNSLKHCPHCDVVYCDDCGKEWDYRAAYVTIRPWVTTLYPHAITYGSTFVSGVDGSDKTYTVNNCTHGK